MGFFTDWFPPSFLSFIVFVSLTSLNKMLRGQRGALNSQLNLADVSIVCVVAAVICFPLWPSWLRYILLTTVFIYGLLLWLDALLFVCYRIEINRQSLMWFFTGSRGIVKGVPELLLVLDKCPRAGLIPVLLAVFLWSSLQQSLVMLCATAGIVCYVIAAFTLNGRAVLGCVLVAIVGSYSVYWTNINYSLVDTHQTSLMYAVTVCLLSTLYFYKYLYTPRRAFFSTPSLLTNIVKKDNFATLKPGAKTMPLIDKVLSRLEGKSMSSYHGKCRGANVIMITMESLGPYITPYDKPLVHSRLAQRFSSHSWISQQHFSLCPNTTVATNQLYTGNYSNNPYNKHESAFFGERPKHIELLKSHGYKTLFLDSADIELYDYQRLLKRIGFDHIWGTKDLPSNGLKADYRLWNMVDVIAKEVGKEPFFLHLINDQTHMPYEVVDKARFSRHKGNNKGKYLNAVEEVDYIIDEFLNRLATVLDLSNTIIMFTGDHGESFGEYGYSFHSNSVVVEQTQVPFFLSHPALENLTVPHSCHFDVFPTLFDLLGMRPEYPYFGQSMGVTQRNKAYFFHSATLKGNTPANFCSLIDDHIYWNDRLFSQTYELKFMTAKWQLQNPGEVGENDISALNSTLLDHFSLIDHQQSK